MSDIEEWLAFTPYYPETLDRMADLSFEECLRHITDYHNATWVTRPMPETAVVEYDNSEVA